MKFRSNIAVKIDYVTGSSFFKKKKNRTVDEKGNKQESSKLKTGSLQFLRIHTRRRRKKKKKEIRIPKLYMTKESNPNN